MEALKSLKLSTKITGFDEIMSKIERLNAIMIEGKQLISELNDCKVNFDAKLIQEGDDDE